MCEVCICCLYTLTKSMRNKENILLLQIIEEDASLVEIGPRFVLNLIKIFQGSFGGPTLYENPYYQSPNMVSSLVFVFSLAVNLKIAIPLSQATYALDLFVGKSALTNHSLRTE